MQLDIPRLLAGLAKKRPVFHSEADFQHSLAWHIREEHSRLEPRLEYPFDFRDRQRKAACDIVLFQDGKAAMALELKYFSQVFENKVKGVSFGLKWSTAADNGRYALLEDIERMENFRKQNPTAQAAVIVVANDPNFWDGPKRENTNDAAFKTQEGSTVTGTLDWAEKTSPKTKRRFPKIHLRGIYNMKWQHYSDLQKEHGIEERYGLFRFLHIPVSKP